MWPLHPFYRIYCDIPGKTPFIIDDKYTFLKFANECGISLNMFRGCVFESIEYY
jgi:hypothetical protein